MRAWLKKNFSTAIIVVVGLVGLGMLLYPTVSDWWNTMHQTQAVASYADAVERLDTGERDRMIAEAEAYNARLAATGVLWRMDEEQARVYGSLLDVTSTGIMGYVDIPKIGITLPVYHGTDDAVLQTAVGHLAGTSLPVGGKGTHCCVSGHRGLPSARLFTDIDQLSEGDRFTFTTLDRVLTYEVDQVRIVLPTELDDLTIDPAQDYMTLITCTPYGVNSHRLLVRGHRVNGEPNGVVVFADAVRIEPRYVAVYLAIPILLAVLAFVLLWLSRNKGREQAKKKLEEELRQGSMRH